MSFNYSHEQICKTSGLDPDVTSSDMLMKHLSKLAQTGPDNDPSAGKEWNHLHPSAKKTGDAPGGGDNNPNSSTDRYQVVKGTPPVKGAPGGDNTGAKLNAKVDTVLNVRAARSALNAIVDKKLEANPELPRTQAIRLAAKENPALERAANGNLADDPFAA